MMTNKTNMAWLLTLAMTLTACSKASSPSTTGQPATNSAPATPAPPAEAPTPAPSPAISSGRGVKTEMHNVLFHLTDRVAAQLETLSGEIWPTAKNEMVVFDDKNSFEVRVTSGKVSITPQALANILNSYVFAKKDAPLKDLSISIDKERLIIKGKLHTKGDISFETRGTVSTTPDGRVRVHTDKVKAMHVPVKGVMSAFGIELADVVNTSKIDGMDTDKNDLLIDLATLLPPPHIKGKVTAVRIENNKIITFFGDGGKSAPLTTEKGNYMTFQGSAVRFGKLIMESTDLTVLDLDPGDPLDWNQDHYKDQLVAGYSRITPTFGLRAYVRDYAKLPRSGTAQPSLAPQN